MDNKNGNSSTIRDSLIEIAVQFLQNPNTQSSPLHMRKVFLKKKGLTDVEIELAIKRSGITEDNQSPSAPVKYDKDQIPVLPSRTDFYYPQHLVPVQQIPSKLMILRDIANSIVVLSGAAYIIYWFYKRYVEPYLFGRKKKEVKKDPVELEIIKLKESVERISTNVVMLSQKIDFTAQKNQNEEHELITHITSLKGLLLNRKQFPATPVTTSTGPASIPPWQLSAEGSRPPSCNDDENKKLENSPTNSSNNSTNNGDGGSDSSIEMIKVQDLITTK